MSKKKNSISFGLGALFGVLTGTVLGILFAPKSGAETQKKIKDTVCDLADKYSPEVRAVKKQAIFGMEKVKYSLEKQYNNLLKAIKAKKLAKAKEIEISEFDIE